MNKLLILSTQLFFLLSIGMSDIAGQVHPDKTIDSLFKLSEYYGTNKIDSCIILGDSIFSYAERLKDIDGIALAYFCFSRFNDRTGDYAKAAEYAFRGKGLFDQGQSNNKTILLKFLIQIGVMHRLIGQPTVGLEYLYEANKVLQKYNLGGYDKDQLYAQLASIYVELNQYDSVSYYTSLVSNRIPSYNNTNMLAAYHNALGRMESQRNNYDQAVDVARQTIDFCDRFNNLFFKASAYQILASNFLRTYQTDSAIHYAKKSVELSLENNYHRHLYSAGTILVKAFEIKNDRDSLLKYLKMQVKANEFLYGKEKVSQLLMAGNNQKLWQKDQDILKEKNRSKNKLIYSGAIILLSTLSLLFLVYRNRQKEKINQILALQKEKIESKNAELENTLSRLHSTQAQLIQSEKMASLGELTAGIAHEIQNPLNFVNNFSELNSELVKEIKQELAIGNEQLAKGEIEKTKIHLKNAIEVSHDIETNSEKINHHGKRAESIVKGMLEHSRKSTGIKEPTDINKLCDEYVRLSYHGLRAKDKEFNCDYKLDLAPGLPLVNVVSQDIGRVILNIVNNAFQACSEKSGSLKSESQKDYKPLVSISTKYIASLRLCELLISDNGPGIPDTIKDKIFQPFFTTKPAGQGTGLGLSLSYDIVKAHGGTIEVKSYENAGTSFVIHIPL
jgi:signal transduction histidine kinase